MPRSKRAKSIKAAPNRISERKKILADELHVPARKNFPRRKVLMRGIDETWQADLIDMKNYSHINKGYNWLLTVIDNLSKYAWAIPLKRKTKTDLNAAFKKLFSEGRIPKNLHVDRGTEFYNSDVKPTLESKNINMYSTFSEMKASIIERFNRTLKTKMWKRFSLQGNYKWYDVLAELMAEYNNTIHRSIGMKPKDVTLNHEENLVKRLNKCNLRIKKPKFKVGDHVRISKLKPLFEKGYTPNWTPDIFTVIKVQKTKPITYLLQDYLNKPLEGGFYEYEMQKVKYPDTYLVEKIIKRRGNQVLVKWLGFDSKHNSWIDKSEL